MRREELFEILGQIDDRFIIPARRERKVIHWNHYVGVAAALCVIVGGVWFLLHMEGSGIGLRPGMPTDPTVVTTAPTDPTDESTQPTTETTAPTETEPTESAESQEDYGLRASLYNLNPDGFFSFVYDGIRQPYQGNGPELDVSQLQVGYRYVHDQKENKVYQISNSPLAEHDGTPITWPTVDYLYFVESDNPATVIRTDYYGQNRTVAYHSEYGEVTCLRYYGVDPQGKLVLVENANRVIMYDIPTGEIEVIMEQPYICYANYTTRYTELPYIQWSGKREGDSEVKLYTYYPDTGEYIELDPL